MTSNKYVITTAQARAPPHKKFIKGLELYAQENDAELIYLPTIGQSATEDWRDMHHFFNDANFEYGKRSLNSNIKIDQFNVRPYQIDPITGLERFAQRETTLIFASPKQRMRAIAHSNLKYPKFLVTTGAATRPNYATSEDVSAERRRIGDIATRDHIYGALVVDIEDNKTFHMRHLRANNRGDFVDLGWRYSSEGAEESQIEAMVCGDWHVGFTDPLIEEITKGMIADYQPNRLILHDFFNGASVSHHCEKSPYTQKLIQIIDRNLHHLDVELEMCNETLKSLDELMEGKPIYVVHSNHHEFLNRYLEEGRHLRDLTNFRTANELLSFMAKKDYNNPVEAGIKMKGKLPRNVHFLKPDDDLKVRGFQLGAHGDKGPSGGRGSMKSKENDWGRSITGHVHSSEIIRDTYTVGTMLPRNMYYMRGYPSKSTNSHAFLYDTGTVQLINIINGKYKSE